MFLWIYIILNTLSLFQLNIIIFFFFIHIYSPKKKKKPQPTQTTKKERKKERKMVSLNLQSLTMANLVYHLVYLTTQMQWPNFHCDM